MDLKLLKLFFVYVHSQKVVLEDNIDIEYVKTLIELADYYLMEDLYRGCMQYIADKSSLTNQIKLL